jgi:hypothetical protein
MGPFSIPSPSFTGGTATGGAVGDSAATASGAWNVNLGGSGTSFQGASSSAMSPLLIAAIVVGAAWLLLRR